MQTTRQTKIRSIVVLIVAALLLELTTAVQFFSTRQGFSSQLSKMAQHNLDATKHTALLKEEVETTISNALPEIERLGEKENIDSLRLLIREILHKQPKIEGIEYCHVVRDDGVRDGLYIFKKDEAGNEIAEQVIDFDYTQRQWYYEALVSDSLWTEPYMGNYATIFMCTYSLPVHNSRGEIIGVLGADVPLSELSALATEIYDSQHRTLIPIIILHVLGLIFLAFIIQRSVNSINRLQKVKAEKERIAGELNIARGIQKAMLPKVFPPYPNCPDIDINASLSPAREVGGDFYEFSVRDEKLFFCIGDVSGKGVPAALVMAVARSEFRMLSTRESSPDRIISIMNDTMAHDNDYNMFITMFVGVLDLPTGRLHYSNAGHKAPFIGNKPLPIDPNLPIGVFPDHRYSAQETIISPNTSIFLYTDGLTEAEDTTHRQFGQEGIAANLQDGTPQEIVERMSSAVNAFIGENEQSDDLTMLAIRYTRKHSHTNMQRSLTLPCDVNQIPHLTQLVDEVCEEVGFSAATTMQVNLALEEAVVNVMNYAYPSGMTGKVTIDAMANSEWLKFVVTDSGRPFDPTTRDEIDVTLPAEERAIGGLGIHLIRLYMDSINYERYEGRNILTLRKKIVNNDHNHS